MQRDPARSGALGFFFVLFCLAVPYGTAAADIISGSAELDYSNFSTKTTDASGDRTESRSHSFDQQYTLNMNLPLYPHLRLKAGGLFEQDDSTFKSGTLDTKSKDRTIYPFVELTLSTPLYNFGAGYDRREEKQTATGAPSTTLVNEDYHGAFGWRPEGLPWVSVLYTKTNTYDTLHRIEDVSSDKITGNVRYTGVKGLDVNYQPAYTRTDDKINGLRITDLTSLARVTYSDQFFNRRVSLNSSANVAFETTKTSAGSATGNVLFQVFPSAGLFSITNDPVNVTLPPDPALIDGNLTVSAGINIGVPPLVGGDTTPRNIGLDFFNPATVDTLYVYVTVPQNVTNSFPQVAGSFSWDIYTSTDNIRWTLYQPSVHGTFDFFQNRFVIGFPALPTAARYLKVVVSPLTAAAVVAAGLTPTDFSNIFVTEMQAFLSEQAGEVRGTTTRNSQLYNLDVRTKILDNPQLFYDLTFFLSHTGGISSLTRYTLANSLFVFHTFNRIYSGSGSIGVENGHDITGSRQALVYTATIREVLLRSLSQSLVFSGRDEETGGRSTGTNSLSLTNTAELYRGIDVNASAALSTANVPTGEKDDTTAFILSANLVPYRTLTMSLNYSVSRTKQSGGEAGAVTTKTQRVDTSASYRPFPTVYLFASYSVLKTSGSPTNTLQNYGINWSPFPEGTLQFNFAYNQNFNSIDNSKGTLISPSVTWQITSRTFLDVSYLILKSTSTAQSSDSKSYTLTLRKYF